MPRFEEGEWLGPHNRPAGAAARAAGRFRYGVGDRFDRHHHDGDELWFITAGSALVRLDLEDVRVATGDILLVPARVAHDIVAVEDELAGFFVELTGEDRDGGRGGHLHASAEDAAGHPIAGPGRTTS